MKCDSRWSSWSGHGEAGSSLGQAIAVVYQVVHCERSGVVQQFHIAEVKNVGLVIAHGRQQLPQDAIGGIEREHGLHVEQ